MSYHYVDRILFLP